MRRIPWSWRAVLPGRCLPVPVIFCSTLALLLKGPLKSLMTQIQPESWSVLQREAAVIGSICSVVKPSRRDSKAMFSMPCMLECAVFRSNRVSHGHRAQVPRRCPKAMQYSPQTRSRFCRLQSRTSVSAPAPVAAAIALLLCALPAQAYFLLTKNSERILQRGFIVKQDSAAFFRACVSVPTSDSVRGARELKGRQFLQMGVDESTLEVPGDSTQSLALPGRPLVSAPPEIAIRMSQLYLSGKAFHPNFFSPVVGQLIPCTDC